MLPGKGQDAAGAQQVAQQAGAEGHPHAVPGAQEHGAEDVDHVLHRGAFAAEDGEGEDAAHHGHRTQDARQGQLENFGIFHLGYTS